MSSDESDNDILKCLEDSGSEFLPDSDDELMLNDVSDHELLSNDDSDNDIPIGKQKKKEDSKRNDSDENSKKKRKPVVGTVRPSTSQNAAGNSSETSPPKKKVVRAVVQAFKKKEERPFGNLLNGVVFVISGYENPLRSELRNKAMAMGARYEANWNPSCTHLICAFRNTPKFNQVRGRGKIVKKEWIEECYSRRVRIPWRRFALDPRDAIQAESEEEIFESIPLPNPPAKRSACSVSSDDDTDDEIEKVRQKQKKININAPKETEKIDKTDVPSTSNVTNGNMETRAVSEYDMDTASEDDNYLVKVTPEEATLPPLPAFFQGATIALLDDLSVSDRNSLTRYIRAHNGAVANEGTDLNTILYAITENVSAVERVREDFPQVIGVTPDWIWASHDEAKILPVSSFKVC